MSIYDRPADEIEKMEKQFLEAFGNKSMKGNVTLMEELQWEPDLYWPIRNRLLDKGLVEKGKGKGGSVRKVQLSEQPIPAPVAEIPVQEGVPPQQPPAPVKLREIDLYPKIVETLKNSWIKDHGIDDCMIEITAMRGKTETGGKWSRPDITMVSYTTYAYVPGKHFDVITFEVKIADGFDVTAVYEALAHRRASTRAWVFLYVDSNELDALAAEIEDVLDEAKKHGIGLIVATDLEKYETWDEKLSAIKTEPDPAKLNEYLSKLSENLKELINRWFR